MPTKNSLTPAGIEPATFRTVAQHLNHCATAVPSREMYDLIFVRRFGQKLPSPGEMSAPQHWLLVSPFSLKVLNGLGGGKRSNLEWGLVNMLNTILSLCQGQRIFKYTSLQADTHCTSQCCRTQSHHYYCNTSRQIMNKTKSIMQ
jgi:hypothetical protein